MNNKVAALAGFTLGITVGVVASRQYFDEKYRTIAEEEIEEYKNWVLDRAQELADDFESSETIEVYDGVGNKVETIKSGGDSYVEPDDTEAVETDYHDISQKYFSTNNDKPKILDMPTYKDTDTPYTISEEEYSSENLHYDKMTLFYYEDDTTLATEEEEVVSDVGQFIGNTLDHLEDEYLYVRNDKRGEDYQIEVVKGSYATMILGVEEE